MVCADFSDILYIGDKRGDNSYIVFTFLSLLYESAIMLHSTYDIYIIFHDIYWYFWLIPLLRFQYTTQWKSQQRFNIIQVWWKNDRKISSFLVPQFWNWIVCQMITSDETLITAFSSWAYNRFKRYESK